MMAAALALLVLATAYCTARIFSGFTLYDDEGFVMLTVRHLLNGHVLYDEILTYYGPAYYTAQLILHSLFGIALTHDNTRAVSLLMWLTAAALSAAVTWRMTRRGLYAAACFLATIFHLETLAIEPGHPQELLGVLLMLAALAGTVDSQKRPHLAAATLGAITTLMLLVKINVGIYALASVLLATVWTTGGRAAGVLRVFGTAGVALLPPLVLWNTLSEGWAQLFAGSVILSVLSIVLWSPSGTGHSRTSALKVAAPFLAGMLVAAFPCITTVLWLGTTIDGLVNGLVVAPLTLSRTFQGAAVVEGLDVVIATVSTCYAFLLRLRVGRESMSSPLLHSLALTKGLFGILVLFATFGQRPFVMIGVATPLLWLALAPPVVDMQTGSRSRVLLALLACLQPLQAFPIPGSQLSFGTLLHVPLGVVCLSDALRHFEQCCPDESAWAPLLPRVPFVALVALTLGTGMWSVEQWTRYSALLPLRPDGQHGASRIRADRRTVALVEWLVSNLSKCSTFQVTIGFNSLYFWTATTPPTLTVVGNSLRLLSETKHRDLVNALSRDRESCVVVHPGFDNPPPGSDRPLLVRFADESLVARGEFFGFTLRTAATRRTTTIGNAVYWSGCGLEDATPWTVRLELTRSLPSRANRLIVIDASANAVIADTDPTTESPRLTVREGTADTAYSGSVTNVLPFDLTEHRHLHLGLPIGRSEIDARLLVLAIVDDSGKTLATLPFLKATDQESPANLKRCQ